MKKIFFFLLLLSLKTFAQSIELKPGSNGFVMIPNVSTLGTCTVGDKGKIVYYGVDNTLRMCNGSTWVDISSTSSLTLPFSSSVNSGVSELFKVTNTSTTDGGIALSGYINGSNNGIAVSGVANNTAPVGPQVTGVYGASYSNNANGIGVRGFHSGTGYAFFGSTASGIAAFLSSTNGYGLQTRGKLQFAGNGVGTLASNKFLKSINSSGDTEWGDILPLDFTKNEAIKILSVTNTSTGPASSIVGTTSSLSGGKGVYGFAQENGPTAATYGVFGFNQSSNALGSGVYGNHYGTGNGVLGESDGVGVKGISAVGKGVWGDGPVDGVRGSTTTGTGVTGTATGINGYGAFFNSTNGPALATGLGNVGIGSIAPKYKLTFNSVLGDKISFWGGETNNTTNHYGIGIGGGALQFFVPTASDNLVFGTGRSGDFSEKMRINGAGNVGIGINNPNATLSITRGTGTDGTAALFGTTHTSHFNYTSSEDTYIRGGKNNSKVLINDVAGLGNVGIGTASPNYKLQVNTVGNGAGIVHANNAGIEVGTYAGFGAGWYGTLTNHPLSLFVNNGNAAINISTNGNVGINTTAANSRLQVEGSLSLPYREISSNYTLTDADHSVRAIGYQSTTISLPSPVGRTGRIFVISADLPLLVQTNGGATVFNPIYIFDNLGNNLLANSNLSEASSGDFLYFLKLLSGKIIKKTSITVQSTGTSWAIIDNDFQF
jgi:hypothetical protein